MRKVQIFLRLVVLAVGFCCVGCGSPSLPRNVPLELPDPEPAQVKREPQVPEGLIGDRTTTRFHRAGCPHCKEIAPGNKVRFDHPYAALDEGYSPCEECEPMVGWQ